jgi:arylsulfatase A-like enzyme
VGKLNIVLVTMDTARAQNFSCYGYEGESTPFLDRIAKENVKYEHAVTQAPWTLPSHSSIFSGEYITNHGNVSKDGDFAEIDSFTDELSDKGYTTIALSNIAYLTEEFNFDQLFDEFEYIGGKSVFEDSEIIQKALEGEKKGVWDSTADKYTDLLVSSLKERNFKDLVEGFHYAFGKYLFKKDDGAEKTNQRALKRLKDVSEPFFLFLNYMEPHAPYRPPFPYSHRFQESKLAWKKLLDASSHEVHRYASQEKEVPEKLMRIQEALYTGEISYLDSKLEELHNQIQEEYPGTVFIFTSDHGEYFGEKGLVNHFGNVHEPVTHVPLVEKLPGEVDKNVGGSVELRKLHDHVLALADGETKPMESVEKPVTEYYGASSSLFEIPDNFTEEDMEYLDAYKAASYLENTKLIRHSTGKEEVLTLLSEKDSEKEQDARKLVSVIREKVGKPEEKTLESQNRQIDEEEVKEKLGDLGYM